MTPNTITFCRILLSIALLLFPPLSVPFYTIYVVAGFTDILDGFVARKTGKVTELGAKTDTVADFVFIAVSMIKILPVLDIPLWMYIVIGVTALVKIVNLVSGCIMRKQFISLHTVANKVAGILLFVWPLTLTFIDLRYTTPVVCAVIMFAAIQEGHFVRTVAENSKNPK